MIAGGTPRGPGAALDDGLADVVVRVRVARVGGR
jgi:hypothetical protein